MNRLGLTGTIAAILFAATVSYLCLFSRLGALGFVGPDEPRYAGVAREMAQSGDWVTPRLFGRPWFEKPALYYWSAAAAFRAFGVSEFAARLPSAVAALVALLALARAAWRLYGVKTAWAVLLIFSTCVGVIGFARAATTDLVFTAMLAWAMVIALDVVSPEGAHAFSNPLHRDIRASALLGLVFFGAWLGLATLAKGPAAIVLAGGSVGLWAFATRHWRQVFRLLHPAALVAFCVVGLPWYVVCAYLNPGFAKNFLLLHNFERYLTPVFQHVQPWWFFGPVLILGLLPWTALVGAVLRDAVRLFREAHWKQSASFFFACWVIFPVLFFSLSESKLPGYVLPVFPPLIILMARSLVRAMEAKSNSARWLSAAVGGTWVALALSASYWLKRLPPNFVSQDHGRIAFWLGVALAGGILIAFLGLAGRPSAALVAAAALMAVLITAATREFLPHLDPYLSPRTVARLPSLGPYEKATVKVYQVRRAWHYGLNFYVGQDLPEWSPRDAGDALVYTNDSGIAELARRGRRMVVIGHPAPNETLALVRGEDR